MSAPPGMLQLREIWVNTPHGEGRALVLIDYGMDHNTCWVVALNDGRIMHYDSSQMTIVRNEMYGVGKIP